MIRKVSIGIAAATLVALVGAFALAGQGAQASGVILIDASPDSDENLVGTQHTVTVLVTDNGTPAQDWAVSLVVVSGPNATYDDVGMTDSNGEVVFAYTGVGGAGTDQIEVCVTEFVGPSGLSAAGEPLDCEIVEKTWVEPTPTPTPEPTATPTASTTPTATPAEAAPAAELPDTGSQPPSSGGVPWSGASMMTLAGAAVLAGGWALSKRTP